MGDYKRCDSFKGNNSHYSFCKALNYTGSWLPSIEMVLEDEVKETLLKVITNKLEEFGEPLTPEEKRKTRVGLDLITSPNCSYPKQHIKNKLDDKYGTSNIDEVIEKITHVKEDGVYHLVNKLNSNWSDLSELITDMVIKKSNNNKYKDIFGFLRNFKFSIKDFMKLNIPKNLRDLKKIKDKVRDGKEPTVWDTKEMGFYLKSLFIMENVNQSDLLNFIKNNIVNFAVNDLKKYVRNTSVNSDVGDVGEQSVKSFFVGLKINVPFVANEGNIVDMFFGVDMVIVVDGKPFTLQVKPDDHKKWLKEWAYKNVDYIATYSGGIKIYDNKNGDDMTDSFIYNSDFSSEDVFPWDMKREPVDEVVENFINTGKINIKEDWLGGTIPDELYKDTLTVQGRSLTFADIWNMFYPYDNNDYPEFREFREKLKRITLKYVNGDEEIANEITDEIFIKKVPGVFKKNREDPTYFRTFELLKTYIIAIFNNANVDVHRKGKVEKGRRDKYLYEPSSGVGSDNDKKYSDEVVQQAFNNIKNEMWKFLIYNKTIHKTKDDKIKVAKITDMWNEEHNDNVAIATMNTYVQRAKEEFKRQLNIAQKEESRRNTNIFAEHVDNYVDKFLDI